MKLENAITKEKRKKQNKRKREERIQKFLYTFIGIPYSKIEKMYLDAQAKRWKKDEEKSKGKVIKEMVQHIKKELARYDEDGCYIIYNSWRSDEVNYGNSMCLHYFHHETKKNKQINTFKRIFMTGKNQDDYYRYFFTALQEHFRLYEDMEVTTGIEKHWSREFEYVKLTFKKDRL